MSRHALPVKWDGWPILWDHWEPMDGLLICGKRPCVDSATVLTPAKGDHAGQMLTVSRAVFHAWATVDDTEAFAGMLVRGVGRGKRFGAGLVLARRAA